MSSSRKIAVSFFVVLLVFFSVSFASAFSFSDIGSWFSELFSGGKGTGNVVGSGDGSGSIKFYVIDYSSGSGGMAIRGASVKLYSSSAGAFTATPESIPYTFSNIPVGTYTATISASGYISTNQTITVNVGSNSGVTISLTKSSTTTGSGGTATTPLTGTTTGSGMVAGSGSVSGSGATPTPSSTDISSGLLFSMDGSNPGTNGAKQSNEGVGGKSVDFDGKSAYVTAPAFTSSQLGLTLAIWTQPRSLGSGGNEITGSMMSKRDSYILSAEKDGSVKCYVYVNGQWQAASTSANSVQLNAWAHWVCTYDDSSLKLYQNAQLVVSTSVSGTLGTSGTLSIGRDPVLSNRWFDGLLDEARVYNRALSPTDVKDLYNLQRGGFSTGSASTGVTVTCTDSDYDGSYPLGQRGSYVKDYYVAGTVTNASGVFKDVCMNSVTLVERMCIYGGGNEYYSCPNGCENGACKSSGTTTTTVSSKKFNTANLCTDKDDDQQATGKDSNGATVVYYTKGGAESVNIRSGDDSVNVMSVNFEKNQFGFQRSGNGLRADFVSALAPDKVSNFVYANDADGILDADAKPVLVTAPASYGNISVKEGESLDRFSRSVVIVDAGDKGRILQLMSVPLGTNSLDSVVFKDVLSSEEFKFNTGVTNESSLNIDGQTYYVKVLPYTTSSISINYYVQITWGSGASPGNPGLERTRVPKIKLKGGNWIAFGTIIDLEEQYYLDLSNFRIGGDLQLSDPALLFIEKNGDMILVPTQIVGSNTRYLVPGKPMITAGSQSCSGGDGGTISNIAYRTAHWTCYDKTDSGLQGGLTSCKSRDVWQSYAEDFCKGRCESGKSVTLLNGEGTRVSVNGVDHTLKLKFVNSANVATIVMDNIEKVVRKGLLEFYNFGDTDLRVIDISYSTVPGRSSGIELYIIPQNAKCGVNSFGVDQVCGGGGGTNSSTGTTPTTKVSCDNGCLNTANKCLPYGYRQSGLYCSITGVMVDQKAMKDVCDNSWECSSNACIEGKCIEMSTWQKFLSWFFGAGSEKPVLFPKTIQGYTREDIQEEKEQCFKAEEAADFEGLGLKGEYCLKTAHATYELKQDSTKLIEVSLIDITKGADIIEAILGQLSTESVSGKTGVDFFRIENPELVWFTKDKTYQLVFTQELNDDGTSSIALAKTDNSVVQTFKKRFATDYERMKKVAGMGTAPSVGG